MLLDALKDGLRVGHLRRVQNIPDDPARQLHLGVLILGVVCKPALRRRLDGVVQVHQHAQPFGAFHAHCTVHSGLLRRCLPQRLRAVAGAAHGPVVVDHAVILLHGVAVPHAFGLPQAHAVLPGFSHRCAPTAVCLHQFCLCLSRLVHGVFQLVQFRVLVPQFAVAVGRPVQNFACQRFCQRLALLHVRAVRLQVLHQHFGLPCKLCPVHPAAVGLCPAAGQPFNVALAHLHAPCQPKELAQRVQRCRLVRNGAACHLLVIPFCIPVGLLCQLEAHIRHLIQQFRTLCVVSGFVQLHRHARVLQLRDQAFARIVRQNCRPHLVKANRPLWLCFKVPCRDLCHVVVQVQDHLRRILANAVTLFCKGFCNGRTGSLALRRPQKNIANDLPFLVTAACMWCSLPPQPGHNVFNLAVRFFQQRFVFLLRYLLQPVFVRPHIFQCFIFCRCCAHQGVGRKPPRAFSACILLIHGVHKIFQCVGVVQLSETAPVSVTGKKFLTIVNAFLSQNFFYLGQQPFFHVCIWCFFLQGLPHGIRVLHHFSARIFRRCILIGIFQPDTQHWCYQLCCLLFGLFRIPAQFLHGPVFFCAPHFFQHRIGHVMVSIRPVRLDDLPQVLLTANSFRHLLVSADLRFREPLLLFHHNIHVFAPVRQIRRLCSIVMGKLFSQLLRAFVRGFHVQCSAQHVSPGKFPLCGLSAQLRKIGVQLSCLIRFHLIFHVRPCRCPCVRAVNTVCAVGHRVNGVASEHQRDRAVLCVAFLRFHHRNGRRRHTAQFQCFLQVLFGQVVHSYKVFLGVHLHRCCQLEAHIFLQRPVISLVFGGFLCYTCVRRYFLSSHSAAPHIHREMCGSIFFFCRFSGIVKCHITTIRPTHFVCIKSFSAVFSCVRVHNYRFVDSGFIHNYRPSKNICVIALALPVFFISNLIAVTNHSRNSCNRSLLCCTISMTHCFIRAIML